MLDLNAVRNDPETYRAGLRRRGEEPVILEKLLELDQRRRLLIREVEELQSQRNSLSREIGFAKRGGGDPAEIISRVQEIKKVLPEREAELKAVASELERLLLEIPNLPAPEIPDGEPRILKTVGDTPRHGTPHWEIGERLGMLDTARGVKVAQARFYLLRGDGAALERALISFMLDLQIQKRGYQEVIPPFLVNLDSMTGTGQYPKFAEDFFTCEKDGLALVPTAEVPVTNLHRDEILEELPLKYTAWTPCFRREAGSYGKETRGLIRVHQFNKIELVRFTKPGESDAALEELTADAESVLETLGLPYRRVVLPADDLGFSARKTYDLEVWMPGVERYVEISSCSNFGDFQARRMRIRYRPKPGAKPQFVHTLNGSALAVGRTWAAILENGFREDGSVEIPPVLRPYLNGRVRFEAAS
ncbi:MAG: serine--tRNA ligase [Candidatus Hydrogenedentota bacterium]|nr:MAG: serine--tRNA ligase [Candidatus Hydrogenedentota bacterium]